MEFLVHIKVDWPPDLEGEAFDTLIARERERGAELVGGGAIKRLWRVPGQWANWGVWSAADATALHDALASLPSFRWATIEVHPLAAHPNDPG
jgi:muconolactone D-isomerase